MCNVCCGVCFADEFTISAFYDADVLRSFFTVSLVHDLVKWLALDLVAGQIQWCGVSYSAQVSDGVQ